MDVFRFANAIAFVHSFSSLESTFPTPMHPIAAWVPVMHLPSCRRVNANKTGTLCAMMDLNNSQSKDCEAGLQSKLVAITMHFKLDIFFKTCLAP